MARAVTIALRRADSPGLAVLAFVPTIAGVFGAAVLLAVGMSFQYPSLMTMALNGAPEAERTRVLSSFTMFFDVGTIVGALVLGVVAERDVQAWRVLRRRGDLRDRARAAVALGRAVGAAPCRRAATRAVALDVAPSSAAVMSETRS